MVPLAPTLEKIEDSKVKQAVSIPPEWQGTQQDKNSTYSFKLQLSVKDDNIVDHKDSIWADILEIKDADGNLITLYLDRQSHLPLKMHVRRSQKTDVHEEVYANYRKIQGVMTAMFLSRYRDGAKTMEIRIDSVEFNSGISDSLFFPPK